MKQLLILLCTACLLLGNAEAQAQTPKKARPAAAKKAPAAKQTGGVATSQELGQLVWEALLANSPDMLYLYFPDEQALTKAENAPDKDQGLVMEQTGPAEVRAAFTDDFMALQNLLIEHQVNLSKYQVSEVRAAEQPKANRLIPVDLVVSDGDRPPLTIRFEAMKVNGRYFLFQNIGLQNP